MSEDREERVMNIHFAVMALVVGFFIGIGAGLIPLICGIVKKRIGLALGGFFGSLVGGAVLGVYLAVPVCCLFTILIFMLPQRHCPNIPYYVSGEGSAGQNHSNHSGGANQ